MCACRREQNSHERRSRETPGNSRGVILDKFSRFNEAESAKLLCPLHGGLEASAASPSGKTKEHRANSNP